MDSDRFDQLACRLANGRTRRGAVRLLLGGGLAALLAGPGVAEAKPKKKCPRGKKACGKKCCAKTHACKQGRCVRKTCAPQSTCGPNCKCWFTVENVYGCYDELSQSTCCDSSAECPGGQGCIAGACSGGGSAGACYSRCAG